MNLLFTLLITSNLYDKWCLLFTVFQITIKALMLANMPSLQAGKSSRVTLSQQSVIEQRETQPHICCVHFSPISWLEGRWADGVLN